MFVQRYYLPLWVCLFLHLCVCVWKRERWEKIDMFCLDLFLSWFCVLIVYFNLSHLVLLFFLLSINSTLHCVLTNTVIAKVRPLPLTSSDHIPNLTTGNKVPSIGKSTLGWVVCVCVGGSNSPDVEPSDQTISTLWCNHRHNRRRLLALSGHLSSGIIQPAGKY